MSSVDSSDRLPIFQIGAIQIAVVSDGIVHVDAGGPFGLTPRALYKHILMPDANNQIPMALHCLLVRVGHQTSLIDTGLGDKLNVRQRAIWGLEQPNGGLLADLARHGVRPADVDLVIDTHLHADHCAGNTSFLTANGTIDEGSVRPVFPNAEYVVQGREYADAMRPNERTRASYVPINYQSLVEDGQMRLLEGDTQIAPGIFGEVARGHTPGMMVIRFASDDQHALFATDLASYAIHFERLGWMTAYDVEPLETLESKRHWQGWAAKTNALILFQHDPKIVAARFADGKLNPVDSV